MSHFTMLALFKEPNPSEAEIGALFAPFNENMEVPEYETPCYCIGRTSKRRASELADQGEGTIDSLREQFWVIAGESDWKDDAKEKQKQWEKHIEKRVDLEKKLLEADPDKDKPEADCDDCHGTGTRMSTYNPKSKWDWYMEGGRWEADEWNRGTVASLLDGTSAVKSSFGILTPEGEWIEQGSMGWWGIVTDEKDEDNWQKEWRVVLEKFKDCNYVLIDCHI